MSKSLVIKTLSNMFNSKWLILRTSFQIVALGIFIFQMKQALLKYVNEPFVSHTSWEPVDTIEKPLIYLCQDKQFNYTNDLGYETQADFLAGNSSGSANATWLGNTQNKSYEQIMEILFTYNYTNLSLRNADGKLIFILPYGFCKQVVNFELTGDLEVHTTQTVRFLILDPYGSINLRAEEVLGHIQVIDVELNANEFLFYKINYKLYDESLQNRKACTDYREMKIGYSQCVENEVVKKLKQWYGCIPTWFPANITKCMISPNQVHDEASKFLYDLVSNLEIKTNCLTPCLHLKMNFERVSKFLNYPVYSSLNLHHDKYVEVFRTMPVYDTFSLIVEVGALDVCLKLED